MTNEEKARTLSLQDHLSNDDYALCPSNDTIVRINAYGAAMEMAEWKEQQMMEKFRDFLNKIGRGQQFGRFEREMKGEEE